MSSGNNDTWPPATIDEFDIVDVHYNHLIKWFEDFKKWADKIEKKVFQGEDPPPNPPDPPPQPWDPR